MARKALLFAALALLFASDPAASQSADPSGLWLTEAGDARVRISRCGGAYCGNIAALTSPIDSATGKPHVDEHNPNPALASRPLVGVRLFGDMRPAGTAKWAGHIYNADDGKTYESSISLRGPNSLRVEGCVMGMCGGENWSRVGR